MKKQVLSFKHALHGLKCAFKTEAHLRFHCFFAILVVIGGFLFQISPIEWGACLLCIGAVISSELINTAIETTIDLITQEHHPLAKKAKDVAAGAVLLWAIISVGVGLLIFLPKFISLTRLLFCAG